MRTIEGFPYVSVQFTKDGAVHERAKIPEATDLVVLCHGWNNTMTEAENFYTKLLGHLRAELAANRVPGLADRTFAVLGVLWPSKKFAPSELTASGAAGTASVVDGAVLDGQLRQLAELIDDPAATAALDEARKLVPELETRRTARQKFAELLRSAAAGDATEDEDASSDLFRLPGAEVMERLAKPVFGAGGRAGAGGSAAGLGRLFAGGPLGAARNLANYLTYYAMKERAGIVGAGGLYDVLTGARNQRLHLVGHSFGARVVTAAVAGPRERPPLRVASLSLLQAAFSHYGFAERYDGTKNGAFHRVVKDGLVSGPILITHTQNDEAVGVAYPLASLLRKQVGSGLGDKNDRFGGLGRNGAQKTPGTVAGKSYAGGPARVYNLLADDFIRNHGDVANAGTAQAVLSAISAGK
ncbi:alpha/beta fold hydrolase [Cryptosporangium sp. NPDC048952]|uniref:alpha/beta fold hydrolase n=1 Tax=Cryptosporangium sp. NPDC048952 TaxID=3363961 RepID=UPI003712738E